MKPSTIFLVTNNYTPYAGGVVKSIDILCNELIKKGHAVYIITLNFLGTQHNDPSYVLRIPSLCRFRYKGNYYALAWLPQAYMRRLILTLKPDIIHVHHPFYVGAIAARLARFYNIGCVFTYHTQYEQYAHYVPLLPKIIGQFCIKKKVQRFCQKISAIVVPTESIQQKLLSEGITTPLFVVASAIDEHFFVYVPRIVTKPVQLLTVSRFAVEKNIPFLLHTMTLLGQDFHLKLVGYGFLLSSLRRYAYRELGLSAQRVSFVVQPTKEELFWLYKQAHIFLFASKTETQGLVLAQALATGLPVIALNAHGSSDTIVHGNNGFLVESEQEMQQVIQYCVDNTQAYTTVQKKAYKSADHYTSDIFVQNIERIYRGLTKD